MVRPWRVVGLAVFMVSALGAASRRLPIAWMGKQPDGSFIVSSGQRIELGAVAFDGRPIDLALHPSGDFFAVLDQRSVFLANRSGVLPGSSVDLPAGAGFRGAIWSPDGARLFVSLSSGSVQELKREGQSLALGERIWPAPPEAKENPRPGGMAITRDGRRLFVADADRSAVAEIDLTTDQWLREWKAQNLPFAVKLGADEQTLIVSNWGGREPGESEEQAASGNAMIRVDPRGAAASGTVSLIDRKTGETRTVDVGLHPTDIVVAGTRAYVANAASDSISVIDIPGARVVRAFPLTWGRLHLFGSMPCALAVHGQSLYVGDGGDNALCEISLTHGAVRGFRPAGYFPMAVALSLDGKTAYVLNTKGNGSVRRTTKGEAGNAHDFQGTVSVVDLTADLKAATAQVARDNHWNRSPASLRPNLAVYHGAIRHVLYIIKENRTYDQVLGDLKDAAGRPEGNGDPRLCDLGEEVTPNAHQIAREFTLFDNAYVSGTNSAEGHAWCDQSLANDYLEHFYAGYRTYSYDGRCAMSISSGGDLWDDAARKGKSIRVYGEFCDEGLARITPRPKDWLEMWKDRVNHTHRFQTHAYTRVASLKKYVHPSIFCWPLLQSDQARADLFLDEYQRRSREDRVPNLMILSLPCDHTAGRNPNYPKPQSMVADNDRALGRIVEAISHSPQWKQTCIFVIEDDAQSGLDHVDGHRTVYLAISPYVRRRFVDSSLQTTVSMVRSIELMLGLGPMTRFDALTPPLSACFTDRPDFTPYIALPNRIPLDDMNPPLQALRGRERYWTRRSLALDWSGLDRPDPAVLNQVIWHSLRGVDTPYPAR